MLTTLKKLFYCLSLDDMFDELKELIEDKVIKSIILFL